MHPRFERHIALFRGKAQVFQDLIRIVDHDRRPAGDRNTVFWRRCDLFQQLGDQSHLAIPFGIRLIDRQVKLAAEVQGKGDDLRVVGEVLGQLSRTVGLEAYRRMVQHEQTLYELRNDPPQVTPTRRAEIGKGRRVEPKPKKETL